VIDGAWTVQGLEVGFGSLVGRSRMCEEGNSLTVMHFVGRYSHEEKKRKLTQFLNDVIHYSLPNWREKESDG